MLNIIVIIIIKKSKIQIFGTFLARFSIVDYIPLKLAIFHTLCDLSTSHMGDSFSEGWNKKIK